MNIKLARATKLRPTTEHLVERNSVEGKSGTHSGVTCAFGWSMWPPVVDADKFPEVEQVESGEPGSLIEKVQFESEEAAPSALIYATRAEYNVSRSPIGFSDQLAVKAKLSVCRDATV